MNHIHKFLIYRKCIVILDNRLLLASGDVVTFSRPMYSRDYTTIYGVYVILLALDIMATEIPIVRWRSLALNIVAEKCSRPFADSNSFSTSPVRVS